MNRYGYNSGRPAWAALAAAVLLGSFGWSCGSPPHAGITAVKSDHQLRLAPDFVLKDSGGREIRLSDYAGKVVALNFWATWCAPCTSEVPWLNDLESKNASRGFAVIGIAMDEQGWAVVKPFVTKLKVTYRILMGNRHASGLYGGVDVLPTTFLIDREGRIAMVYAGIVNRRDFERSLDILLRPSGAVPNAASSRPRSDAAESRR